MTPFVKDSAKYITELGYEDLKAFHPLGRLFGDCACAAQHGAPPCPAGGDPAGFLNAGGGLPSVVKGIFWVIFKG